MSDHFDAGLRRGVVADDLRAALQERPDLPQRGEPWPVIENVLVDGDRLAVHVEALNAVLVALNAGLPGHDPAVRHGDVLPLHDGPGVLDEPVDTLKVQKLVLFGALVWRIPQRAGHGVVRVPA